jgi:hypothetical protein
VTGKWREPDPRALGRGSPAVLSATAGAGIDLLILTFSPKTVRGANCAGANT